MVDVGSKEDSQREAVAAGKIFLGKEALEKVNQGQIKKGDVLAVAQVGGIMGAKKTAELIPMAHNIFISGVDMSFNIVEDGIEIQATAKTIGKTGIEMEALTAVSIAALTIYDMCKAIDKKMVISDIKLLKKTGGKSGDFYR